MRAVLLIMVSLIGLVVILISWMPSYERLSVGSDPAQGKQLNAPNSSDFPFMESMSRHQAIKLLVDQEGALFDAERHIKSSIRDRTLYAPSWLILAEIKLEQKSLIEAKSYIDAAVRLWPNRPLTLWRASVLYIRLGENHSALSTLKKYLTVLPNEIQRVATIAIRLEKTPERLIDMFVPGFEPANLERNYYLNQLLRYSITNSNVKLAESCWKRIHGTGHVVPDLSRLYLGFLQDKNLGARYKTVFYQLADGYGGTGVVNGGFEMELTRLGTGWMNRFVNGVKGLIDSNISKEGKYSYRLDFDGKQNINYYHFSQKLPLQSGKKYLLSGFWKGREVSTRSTPFIEISSINSQNNQTRRSVTKRGTWEWERFEITFTVPEDAWLVRIRVRRFKTDALDQLISGSIWLDDITLESVSEESN